MIITAIVSLAAAVLGFLLWSLLRRRKNFLNIFGPGGAAYFVLSKDLKFKTALGGNLIDEKFVRMGDSVFSWVESFVYSKDSELFASKMSELRDARSDSELITFRFRSNDLENMRYYKVYAHRQTSLFSHGYFALIFDETELARESKLQRDILDGFPGPVYAKNFTHSNAYIFSNKYHTEIICKGDKSFFRTPKTDYDIFDAVTAGELCRIDSEVPTDGRVFKEFIPLVDIDGVHSTFYSFKTGAIKENGDKLVYGMCFDINELLEVQKDLQHTAEREQVVNKCLKYLLYSWSERSILEAIVHTLGTTLGSDRCYIYNIDYEKKEIPNYCMWCAEGISGDDPLRLNGDSFMRAVEIFKESSIIKINDSSSDESSIAVAIGGVLADRGIKSILIIGVWKNAELVGLIGVDYVREKHVHTSFEEQILRSVASIVEIFIQRRAAQEKIEQSEAEKRMILESLDIPVLLFDADAKLLFVNSASAKMVGKPVEQILREPCYENYCGLPCMDERCVVKRIIREGRPGQLEAMQFGREVIVKHQPIFDKSGEVKNVIEFHIDVTEFNEKGRALEKAMDAAKTADRAKSYFLATMSHELRTPLNAVIGYSELTQDPSLTSDERAENLRSINFAANALLTLINDVLDLSTLEAGRIDIHKKSVNMRVMVTDLARVFKFRAQAKNIGLEMDVPEDFPTLMLDALRIKQVLMNIIGNAVKFTDLGGVFVRLEFLKDGGDSGTLKISVKDSGMGIAEDFLEKIFDPFERQSADKVRGSQAFEGSGLGLPISNRLMEQMGGKITIFSKLDEGSTFILEIPHVKIADDAPEEPRLIAEPQGRPFRISGDVVIVDDVSMNLKVLGAVLKKLGIDYVAFLSGREACEYVRHRKPAIILTDLWMPEMNGAQLAKNIRENSATVKVPVVAITADTQFDAKDFDDVILKPITVKDVRGIFEKFFAL